MQKKLTISKWNSLLIPHNYQKRKISHHKIDPRYKRWAIQAINKWNKKIKVFDNIDILFLTGSYYRVGEYFEKTFRNPLICLFIDMIELESDIEGLEAAFKITLYHEFGHALCEYHREYGIKIITQSKEEDFVEELARRIHYNQPIHPEAILMNQVILLYSSNSN